MNWNLTTYRPSVIIDTGSSAAEAILYGGTHWGGDSLSESGNTFRSASRGGWERSTRR